LSAAALLMLVWDPYLLEDVGFQLSFLVTAGLILGVQPVRKLLPRGKRSKALFDLIAVTVVAQAVSFPLTIYYFNQIHLLSLLANFILVPFISFIVMPLGGAALVLDSLWHAGAAWLGSVASVANRLSFGVVLQLSGFQQLRFIIGSPPFGWVLYMYASIGLCLSLLHRRGLQPIFGKSSKQPDNDTRPMGGKQWVEEDVTQPLGSLLPNRAEASLGASGSRQPIQSTGRIIISVLLCLALIAPILWAYYPKWNNNDAYVSFLDVGQGDSILIRTAHGKHILIDGGGSVSFRKKGEEWKDRDDPFEVGRKVLVPLLQ
ncbi:ComEC/Rec2 family competence protein, partial [Paenibacillus sepulcri]|nr:ComEC/Rec2 family competence protein [Paenibacillus sepulcri]